MKNLYKVVRRIDVELQILKYLARDDRLSYLYFCNFIQNWYCTDIRFGEYSIKQVAG